MRLIAALAGLLVTSAAFAEPIKVSSSRSTGSAPLYIALERNYFRDEGLEAQLIYFDSAQAGQIAVVSGDTEVGMGGMSGTFFNLVAKNALKIIAGGSREMPGFTFSAYVVSNKAWDGGLRAPKDLAGKSAGITTVGSIFSYTLQRVADKYGFPFTGMRTVPLQSFTNIASAVKGGAVDIGTLTAPTALPLIQRGDAKLLAWMADETPFLSSGVFTSGQTLQAKRPLVERFLKAWRRGAADYASAFLMPGADANGTEAKAIIAILAKHTKLDEAEIRASLPFIDPTGSIPMDEIERQVDVFKRMKMIEASVTAAQAVDTTLSPSSSLEADIAKAKTLKP
jgi:NitT/TauT family transport system substrate-binding protein